MPSSPPRPLLVLGVCSLLVLAVAAVFGPTVGFDFVNYDDDLYVYNNAHIARGLTSEGLVWIVTQPHCGNWHPLTSLSHMLDCQFFGLRPGQQHLLNVVLHASVAVLTLLVLWQLTGRFWSSAVVAAIFAVHPLRVESVAWISQRKDVLAGLFFWLVLAAYLRYAGRPVSIARYFAVVLLFALGLLAKPMLVTLPFVLLLLDYWPLERLNRAVFWRRIGEKLPLLLLSLLACLTTLWAQREAFLPDETLSLPWRIGNALLATVGYLKDLVYPTSLAVLYPHPGRSLSVALAAAAGALLLAISLAVWLLRQKCPYLLVGWCWYLGMLVPVSGLVQVGSQAAADRYTYLPQVGLLVALVWLAGDLLRAFFRCPSTINSPLPLAGEGPGVRGCSLQAENNSSTAAWLAWAACLAVIAILGVAASRQTLVWRDSIALWTQTLANARPHPAIHNNLGIALADAGRTDEAAAHYRQALALDPHDAKALSNLGNLSAGRGQFDEAIIYFRQALALSPENADALSNLGNALAMTGQSAEALACYEKAIRRKPDFAEVYANRGNVLAEQGRLEEALASQRQALALKPSVAETHFNLGNALLRLGRREEALACYRQALTLAEQQGKPRVVETIRTQLESLSADGRR